ncbi:MAG: protein kinase [Kiloniellaceae bacterium]|nr:protein kinase [Kiloniellaceae bacterium]
MTLPSYVGRYRVCSEIARGGFASVVRAWDDELESLVAIKILHPNLASDEGVQARFVDEARLLRRIRSPNVVTVHDVGRLNDGRPYFVMDFADRGTLEERISSEQRTTHDPRELTVLVDALADGLAAIHEAGVVHRDIKPANILLQLARRGPTDGEATLVVQAGQAPLLVGADERILVGDLGIAKDLAKRGPLATIVGGTPLYEAPEQRDGVFEVTPASDIYSATALLWHVLTAQRPPSAEALAGRLPALAAAWHPVIGQGMALDPGARFTTIESWRSAVHDVLAGEVAAGQIGRDEFAVQHSTTCPYKGLASYQSEDAGSFFGREALIDELVRRLRLERVLVVGGPSGSGKSSLVRAGLIPALGAGALAGSETWRSVLFTPGRDPLVELHYRIASILPSVRPPVSVEDLLARPTLARHLGESGDTQTPLLLCIDQFEELFTLSSESQRQAFITALSAMTDPADSKVRLVIAVRADFYAACAQMPWLAECITGNQVLVGPMTRSELRRAISEPARRAGLYVERNLLEAITEEAGDEAGSLPLVAHALVETWIRREGNTLTLEGFREAGGVTGAISQTADATYQDKFGPAERNAAKRLFLRLVAPGEDTPDTRRVLARCEIDHDAEPEVMQRVIKHLTEVRLLTVDDQTVQIAHEALLRTWPRLRGWIEECRDDLRMRQRIARAATEWEAAERDADLLYRGTPLLTAQEWLARNPGLGGDLESTFLAASAAAKAEGEALAAERERRTLRTRRFGIALLASLAVGASAASVVAILALREARHNAQVAEAATAVATERFAGALGAAAHGLVETDPMLALALAGEAVARAGDGAPGYQARAAMIAARRALSASGPFLLGSPISAGDALSLAMSPDGTLLATGQRNGTIDLIDVATRRPAGPSLRGHRGGVQDLAFAPDGQTLASAGDDGAIYQWRVADGLGDLARNIGQTPDVVWGLRFDPQGMTLASASEDGTVQLWKVEGESAAPAPLINRVGDFLSVAFAPDGAGLVAGNGEGDIFGWALPSETPLFKPIHGAHTSDVWKLEFSLRGDRFATASSDATSMVVDYPSGRIVGPAFTGVGGINDVAFTANGEFLIGGGSDGALHLWNLSHDRLTTSTSSGHSQPIIDVELSQDGRLLATLGRDQLIRLWALGRDYPLAQERRVAGQSAKGLAISADGSRIAASDDAGVVQVWPLGGVAGPVRLTGHGRQVWAVAFSPDGNRLASGDRSGEVRLWDLESNTLRWSAAVGQGSVWSLAFIDGGSRLAIASDGGVHFWTVETGTAESSLDYKGGHITRAALSPDGASLAVAATDGHVQLWDLASATMTSEIAAEDGVVWSLAFSPDRTHLATASSDEVVTLWNVASGERVSTMTGHIGGATDLAFLADGVTLVVVDRRGNLHLWDVPSARRLGEIQVGHQSASWRIAVHVDGQRFATAGDDGRVRLWDELSIARACEISQAAFDSLLRAQYLGAGVPSEACD